MDPSAPVHLLAQGDAALRVLVAVVALLLVLLARVVLPRAERGALALSTVFVAVHIVLAAIGWVLPPGSSAERWVDLVGLFALLVGGLRIAVALLLHLVVRTRARRAVPKILADLISGVVYLVAALVTLERAGVAAGSLLTTSALLTAVVGLSLQDTLGNLFAGLAIQAQRPFLVGDFIQYGDSPDSIGRVLEINWRATTVQTNELVEITVPNGTLAKAPIRNFSRQEAVVRRTVHVTMPYDVAPDAANRLLRESARHAEGVLGSPPVVVAAADFTERGVLYAVHYFIADFARREQIAGRVRASVHRAMIRAQLTFPLPRRIVETIDPAATPRVRSEDVDARRRVLERADLVAALPEDARRTLAAAAVVRVFGQGETVVREGDKGDELFVVETGCVAVLARDQRGIDREIATLGEGALFGEMSVMTGEPRRSTVRATTETVLLSVDRGAFKAVLESAPELAERIGRTLVSRREEQDARLAELERRAEEREREQRDLMSRIRQFFSMAPEGSEEEQ